MSQPLENHEAHLLGYRFAELEERVFDVLLQGESIIERFNIVKEAGGPRTVIRKEFNDVMASTRLELSFKTHKGTPVTVINRIEVISQSSTLARLKCGTAQRGMTFKPRESVE